MTAFAFSAQAGKSTPQDDIQVTGPHIHGNLSIYFIHGKSAPGETPLTLDEALQLKRVRVTETGDVNELQIENLGNQPIFIQSGDIVKGGKQDRVITSSFILKPKSGAVPLAAFCVEQGRWARRGAESAAAFASSSEAMPSRKAKMSLRMSAVRASRDHGRAAHEHQAEVWQEVEAKQAALSKSVEESVAARESASSLQLSLENEKLQAARGGYVDALEKAGLTSSDIVGYAFAVNGRINSADVYGSNALFRKMWTKQLKAAATEALGDKAGENGTPPAAEAVTAFLKQAKATDSTASAEQAANRIDFRSSDTAMYMSASMTDGAVVHENYLAK